MPWRISLSTMPAASLARQAKSTGHDGNFLRGPKRDWSPLPGPRLRTLWRHNSVSPVSSHSIPRRDLPHPQKPCRLPAGLWGSACTPTASNPWRPVPVPGHRRSALNRAAFPIRMRRILKRKLPEGSRSAKLRSIPAGRTTPASSGNCPASPGRRKLKQSDRSCPAFTQQGLACAWWKTPALRSPW